MLLADYFDTGPEGSLDVTPTDLLVGLHVLSAEQQRMKQERLTRLQQELLDESSDVNGKPQQPHTENDVNDTAALDEEHGAIVFVESVATGSFDCSDHQDSDSSGCHDDEVRDPALHASRRSFRRLDPGSVRNLQLYRTSLTAQPYFQVATRQRLRRENETDRTAILDGAHYMRIAIAVYGHLMYLLQHTCTAPCCLAAGLLTCCRTGCTNKPSLVCDDQYNTTPRIVGDNRCGCNELGLLRLAGLNREDIAYVSFQSGIHVCPYGIVIDRTQQSVVVAIRGTFSLEAMVTDLNIRPEPLDRHSGKYATLADDQLKGEYCHSGMLQCALEMYNDLERHQILDRLLLGDSPKFPGFKVVITGHSLGAGIGSILSLLLAPKFPGLRCLCFSPPGCVMSTRACAQSYITSYVLDSDVVPRMSLHSIVGLRNDILEMIARIKVPKHVALSYHSKSNRDLDVLLHPRESIPESTFYKRICDFHDHQKRIAQERSTHNVTLHVPGAIVHIVESLASGSKSSIFGRSNPMAVSYVPVWAEINDFSEIQVNKSMVIDHHPERMCRILKMLASSFQ
jgi:sn1-specific diacylglycerol lipase